MSLHDAAKRVLSPLCDERYEGFGVVFSESPTVERIPRRRHHAREREQQRVSDVAREVAADLRGGFDRVSAAEIVASADLKESITVTQGYAALLEAVVERFRSGDNVWVDVSGAEKGVIVLHFWHDSSHPRVADPYPLSGRPVSPVAPGQPATRLDR